MSDTPSADATQADAPAQPQAGTETTTVLATDVTTKPLEKVADLPQWAQDLIGGLRRESAGKRKAQEGEASEAQTLRGQLDELAPRYSDLQGKYNALRATLALRNAGADEEAADLLAAKLDPSVLDDKDKLVKAIDTLRKERPRLFNVASLDGGARGNGTADRGFAQTRLSRAYDEAKPRR